jgi:hypothetical protein
MIGGHQRCDHIRSPIAAISGSAPSTQRADLAIITVFFGATPVSSALPVFDIHTDPPTSPDVSLIGLLHRNAETRIAFSRVIKKKGTPVPSFARWRSFPVSELRKRSGTIRRNLSRDGYFTIHGFRTRFPREEDVSALNAALIDLDFYKAAVPLTWQEAIGQIESAISDDLLPRPSILVRSGQGAWLLWLLVSDNDPARAPAGPPTNQRFLRDINRRLAIVADEVLPQLGVDRAVIDLVRSLRVPGSVNSKSASYVHFIVGRTPTEQPLTYTLEALGKRLGVAPPRFGHPQKSFLRAPRTHGEAVRHGGRTNLGSMLGRRLFELERLEAHRGGFSEGIRNHALLIFASTLAGLHRTSDEIIEYLDRAGARCRPPVYPSEARAALRSATEKHYRYRSTRIAELLRITSEEVEALGLIHLRLDFRPKYPEAGITKGRRETALKRQVALRKIVESAEVSPPLRVLVRELQTLGFSATPRTVARDLDRMDMPRSRRRGRPRLGAQQIRFPVT